MYLGSVCAQWKMFCRFIAGWPPQPRTQTDDDISLSEALHRHGPTDRTTDNQPDRHSADGTRAEVNKSNISEKTAAAAAAAVNGNSEKLRRSTMADALSLSPFLSGP